MGYKDGRLPYMGVGFQLRISRLGVRIASGVLNSEEPIENDIERFLSVIRFDAKSTSGKSVDKLSNEVAFSCSKTRFSACFRFTPSPFYRDDNDNDQPNQN